MSSVGAPLDGVGPYVGKQVGDGAAGHPTGATVGQPIGAAGLVCMSVARSARLSVRQATVEEAPDNPASTASPAII